MLTCCISSIFDNNKIQEWFRQKALNAEANACVESTMWSREKAYRVMAMAGFYMVYTDRFHI